MESWFYFELPLRCRQSEKVPKRETFLCNRSNKCPIALSLANNFGYVPEHSQGKNKRTWSANFSGQFPSVLNFLVILFGRLPQKYIGGGKVAS